MKFNWGTGIALSYIAFVAAMLGLVFASRQHDPGLVQKDYYDLDIHYQERLDKKQNAAGLPDGLPVHFDAAQNAVVIEFPVALGTPGGSVKLFRSMTLADDVKLDIKADENGVMVIPTKGKPNGAWHIEIDWTAGDRGYFNETVLTITNV